MDWRGVNNEMGNGKWEIRRNKNVKLGSTIQTSSIYYLILRQMDSGNYSDKVKCYCHARSLYSLSISHTLPSDNKHRKTHSQQTDIHTHSHTYTHTHTYETSRTCVSIAVVSILLSMPREGFSRSKQNSSISSNNIIVLQE
jgi:hypothetical protein